MYPLAENQQQCKRGLCLHTVSELSKFYTNSLSLSLSVYIYIYIYIYNPVLSTSMYIYPSLDEYYIYI